MRFGLDIDGCLADFNAPFINLIREVTGIELPEPSATYPNTWSYHLDGGVTKLQNEALWHHITTTNFWFTLEPYPETRSVLRTLMHLTDHGHDVYFITNRPGKGAKRLTELWFLRYGFAYPTVLIAPSDKSEVVRGLDLHFYLDDKLEHAIDVSERSHAATFLLDKPYNQGDWSIPLFARVNSVTQALQQFIGENGL